MQYCQSTQIVCGTGSGSSKFPCMSHTPPSVKASPHALRGKEEIWIERHTGSGTQTHNHQASLLCG